MFLITHSIQIAAPIERCFQLSTSLALVEHELHMHPIPAPGTTRTSGLAQSGDRIHWSGRQFGLPQFHVSLISGFDPPYFFEDTMIAGRFRTFQHQHRFTESAGQTLLSDTITFTMPFGPLGALVGRLILVPHIRRLLRRRFLLLKRIAESEEWRACLPNQQ
jgi:ligand-binding SRPBCC domain-containing protein